MMGQNDRQKEYLKEMHYRGGGIFHGASAIFPGGLQYLRRFCNFLCGGCSISAPPQFFRYFCSLPGVYITPFSLKVKIDKFCSLKFSVNTHKISQKDKKNLKSTRMQFKYKIHINRSLYKLHKNRK